MGNEIYLLFACNEWKEKSSMRIVGATTNQNLLYAMVGSKIKEGEMLYRSDDRKESWEYFRQDYQRNEVRPELLEYGHIETMRDLSLTDPMLAEDFRDTYSVYEILQRSRTKELLKPLALDRQQLVFSVADMHSAYGFQRVFLPGYGLEEALKESDAFKDFAKEDEYTGIHVDVSSYIVGTGDVKEADWEQTRIIEEHFTEMIDLYEVNLQSSDYYNTYYEMEQEEP